jgi:hypothetical protein
MPKGSMASKDPSSILAMGQSVDNFFHRFQPIENVPKLRSLEEVKE